MRASGTARYGVKREQDALVHTQQAAPVESTLAQCPWDQVQFWSPTSTTFSRSLSLAAGDAVIAERRMTFWEGCNQYPQAIAWSLLVSCAIIMEAYDKCLISNLYALPSFRKAYGYQSSTLKPSQKAGYQISSAWQAGLINGAVCGEIFGLLFNGYLTERLGYRKTMILTLAWMSLSIFLTFFAVGIKMLLISQILCG